MISLKIIRENKEKICKQLSLKGYDTSQIDVIVEKDILWRKGVAEVEKLKEQRNRASKEISVLKKDKKNADSIIKEMQSVSAKIKEIDIANNETKFEIDA